jgi:hypothetical protein
MSIARETDARSLFQTNFLHFCMEGTVKPSVRSRVIPFWANLKLACSLWGPISMVARKRVAETRAVNRALRKAYGIGLCSVEELGWVSGSARSDAPASNSNSSHSSNGSNGRNSSNGSNGSPSRLRDKLCLLIRQYNLDPTLVKEYAAHFCGTETIKDASRDLVESFIAHLSSSAKEDIDGLICKLNSFSRPVEVKQ